MSQLSREIAKWIQTNPGPILGENDDSVWLQAKLMFERDRRWRGEIDMALFMQHVANIGYRTERRTNHGDKSEFSTLALPEPHRGF